MLMSFLASGNWAVVLEAFLSSQFIAVINENYTSFSIFPQGQIRADSCCDLRLHKEAIHVRCIMVRTHGFHWQMDPT